MVKGIDNLRMSLLVALPFFRNSLLSFFGSQEIYRLVKKSIIVFTILIQPNLWYKLFIGF